MSDLYRLVYASKNLLQGSEAEIAGAVSQILAASQRNNAEVGVTGALMFNAGAFAQVLEGPKDGVEATFERIQCDPRHGDVTVLQCGVVESRTFANWSMAFVGQSRAGRARWEGLAAASGFDLTRLDGDAVFAMLHGLVLEEEGLAPAAGAPSEPASRPDRAPPAMDVERVRAELPQLGRAPQARPEAGRDPVAGQAARSAAGHRSPKDETVQAAESDAVLSVLRSALAEERQRRTDLRNELDAARIALALQQEQSRTMRQERDLWAKRSQLLAAVMSQEAGRVAEETSSRDAPGPGSGEPDRRTAALRAIA